MSKIILLALTLTLLGVNASRHRDYGQHDSRDDISKPIARYLSGPGYNKGCPMCNLKPIVDQYEKFNRHKQVPPRDPRLSRPSYLMDIFDLPRYAAEIAKKTAGERKQILADLLDGMDWNRLPIIEVE